MDYILYFFIYSVAGYIIETIYTLIVERRYSIRRSMLKSPMCVVYGAGGTALALFAMPFARSAAALFAAGVFLCSATEYMTSLLYEKICGVILWDYSHERANLNGRVCALYSFYWGVIAVVFCRYIHPVTEFFVKSVTLRSKMVFTVVFLIYFFKDLRLTLCEMKKLGKGEKSLCDGVLEYIVPAPERKIF